MARQRSIFGVVLFLLLAVFSFAADRHGGPTGVKIDGVAGVFKVTGLGGGFDENMTLDFNSVSNTVVVGSESGVSVWDWSGLNFTNLGTISCGVITQSGTTLDNTYLALVGGTMTGNLNLGGNSISNASSITTNALSTGTIAALGDYVSSFGDITLINGTLSSFNVSTGAITCTTITATGDVNMVSDNTKFSLGIDSDASISYDGTDPIIDPAVVGSGVVKVYGELEAGDPVSNTTKVKLTAIGGYAIKLTNKTGANTVAGNTVVVYSATAIDDAVTLTIQDVPDCIGVFLDSGIADGSEAWVVIAGIADVYYVGTTVRGYLARTFVTADGDYVTGQAKAEAVPTSPFATDKHFAEIGHCIESRTGAGLARTVLHFN